MKISLKRAEELRRMITNLRDGPNDKQIAEIHKLINWMSGRRSHLLEVRIVGDTPLLVHRMSDRALAALAGEIPWPRWDEDVGRQHEAATAAADMIARH